MSIIIGIDHGYYAIKTAHCSFPAGLTSYGEHEPYTRQGLLELAGCFFVCGTGRQPIQRDKTLNDNYYLLTLATIAKEIHQRCLPPECSVRIAAGLPLTSFGRGKPKFRDYLLRSRQPVIFKFEGVEYSITTAAISMCISSSTPCGFMKSHFCPTWTDQPIHGRATSTAAPTPLWNISRAKSWRCATGRGFTKSTS